MSRRKNKKTQTVLKKNNLKYSGDYDVINQEYVDVHLNAGGPPTLLTRTSPAITPLAGRPLTPVQRPAVTTPAPVTPPPTPAPQQSVQGASAPALPSQAQVDQMDCGQLQTVWNTTQGNAADYQSPQSLYIQWQQISSYIHTKLVACQNAPANQPSPVAVIAPVTNPVWPDNLVTLDGSGSSQSGGGTLTYLWTFISASNGGQYVIQSPDTAETQIIGLTNNSKYNFQLTVKNASQKTATKSVSFTVVDTGNAAGTAQIIAAPVANAGEDQTISLPTSEVMLDGSNSYDPAGEPLSAFAWSMVSGPAGAPAPLIVGQNQAKVTVTNLSQGTYVFQLTVTSATSQKTATAKVTVTVSAPDTSTAPIDTSTDNTNPVSAVVPALIVPLSPYGTTYPAGGAAVGAGGGGDDGGGDTTDDTTTAAIPTLSKKWLWIIPAVIILGFIIFDKDKDSKDV